jgi:hypothetical protein
MPRSKEVVMTIATLPRVLTGLDGTRALTCACSYPPELHQPDVSTASALIGICPTCGRWTIFEELEADWASALAFDVVLFDRSAHELVVAHSIESLAQAS